MPNDHDDVDTYRFCPECGAQAAERAKFCGECGRSLIKEAAEQGAAQSADQLPPPPMTTDLPTVQEPSQAPAVATSMVRHHRLTAPYTSTRRTPNRRLNSKRPGPARGRPTGPSSLSLIERYRRGATRAQSDPWTVPFTGPDPSAEQQEPETAAGRSRPSGPRWRSTQGQAPQRSLVT